MVGKIKPAVAQGAKGFFNEFMDFLYQHKVVGLAVAFVIGSAATKLVTAIVNDLVMPVIAVMLPGGDWNAAVLQVGPIKLLIGDFTSSLIDFVIIALVVFAVVKFVMRQDDAAKA